MSFKQCFREISEDLEIDCMGKDCLNFSKFQQISGEFLNNLCFDCFNSLKELTINDIGSELMEICHHFNLGCTNIEEFSHNCLLCDEELYYETKQEEFGKTVYYYGHKINNCKGNIFIGKLI